jgi:FkbM family methyltransferase
VKKTLSTLLRGLGVLFLKASKFMYVSPQERRCISWFNADGDKTLRLNYELESESLVFDLGGYEGQWSSDIFSKYGCCIHIFEPVEAYAKKIKQRFVRNNKIIVHEFGLSNATKESEIFIDNDSSSILKAAAVTETINLVKSKDFIRFNNITNIDLMKINIEGAEYDLLDHLMESGIVNIIDNIQIQFHDMAPNAVDRMARIQNDLSKTHFLTYQFVFVWENWQRR